MFNVSRSMSGRCSYCKFYFCVAGCEKCGIHNIGECFIHGGKMTVTPDNTMPTRACLSLPKILTLKRVRNSEPCALEGKK